MYIESVPNRNSPPAILLRESYRDENGKVRKRTLANLSKWDPQVVEGLRSLLRGGTVSPLPMEQSFKIIRSLSHGNVAAVLGSFRNIGLDRIISSRPSQHRDLSIAMITARNDLGLMKDSDGMEVEEDAGRMPALPGHNRPRLK